MDVKTGTIRSYSGEYESGWVIPDVARADLKHLLFSRHGACKPVRGTDGLGMDFADLDRFPKEGDHVVYVETDRPRYSVASQWCFAEDWEEASRA